MDRTVTLPTLLTFAQVREYTNLGRGTLYALIDAGEFPKPIKLTPRSHRWVGDDVDAWVKKITDEQHGHKVDGE